MLPYVLIHIITIIFLHYSPSLISCTPRTTRTTVQSVTPTTRQALSQHNFREIRAEREQVKKRIYDLQTANIIDPALAVASRQGINDILNASCYPDAEIFMIALRYLEAPAFATLLERIMGTERDRFLGDHVHYAHFGSPLADAIYDVNVPVETIEILLKAGADPNMVVSRGTPLELLLHNVCVERTQTAQWPARSIADALKTLDLLVSYGAEIHDSVPRGARIDDLSVLHRRIWL